MQSRIQVSTPDTDKLRAQIRLHEVELESYRGGESKRNQYLMNELGQLRSENDTLKHELARSREQPQQLSHERSTQDRKTLEQSRRIEDLGRQLQAQQEDFERKLRRVKDDYERQIQIREPRVLEASKDDDRLKSVNR